MQDQLSPLAPTPFEVLFALAFLVAVVFAGYAVRKVSRREWTPGAGITLAVLTFLVPFSGPLLVLALRWRARARGAASPA